MLSANMRFQAVLRNPVYNLPPTFTQGFEIMVWPDEVGRSSWGMRIDGINKGDKIASRFDERSHLLSPLISARRGDSYEESKDLATMSLTQVRVSGRNWAAYVKS